MLGYPCSARKQLQRLGPLLLATIVTLIVPLVESQGYCGPKIFTYGEAYHPKCSLPYQIQTPVLPQSAKEDSPCRPPEPPRYYGYGISAPPSKWHPSNVGFQLPVSVQEPVLPESHHNPPPDPFRGKSYGIGIQNGPSAQPHVPSLGSFDFGVQKSVPGQPTPRDPPNRFNIQVQPVPGPRDPPSLWGPLPFGIERPAHEPREEHAVAPPKRLTGLTSSIDRLLIPASELPYAPCI